MVFNLFLLLRDSENDLFKKKTNRFCLPCVCVCVCVFFFVFVFCFNFCWCLIWNGILRPEEVEASLQILTLQAPRQTNFNFLLTILKHNQE